MVIVLQAVTLFVIAKAQGADTPYMAFKMMYLAIYPMAVAGRGYAMASPERAVARESRASAASRRAIERSAGCIAAVLIVVAVRPALMAPRPVPVVDLDLYDAGQMDARERRRSLRRLSRRPMPKPPTGCTSRCSAIHADRSGCVEIDRYEPRAAVGAVDHIRRPELRDR